MTRTISLPFTLAKTAATAVLPHVSADDVTPALTAAVIRERHLIGTDRYSVGDYDLTSPPKPVRSPGADQKRFESELEDWERRAEVRYTMNDDADDWTEPFYVPRAALARVSTFNERQSTVPRDMLSYSRVHISEGTMGPEGKTLTTIVSLWDDDVEVYRQVFIRPGITHYPPVWTLLADWKPQEGGQVQFGIMPSNLQKVLKTIPKWQAFTITAGEPARNDRTGEAARPAPMMVETGDSTFRALIQPALILR